MLVLSWCYQNIEVRKELEGVGERKQKEADMFRKVGKLWKEKQRFPGQLQFRPFQRPAIHVSWTSV